MAGLFLQWQEIQRLASFKIRYKIKQNKYFPLKKV